MVLNSTRARALTLAALTAATGAKVTVDLIAAADAADAAVTVVGAAVETPHGVVQVAVTFTGDTMTGVETLARPEGDTRSDAINDAAIPTLEQAVLEAQSAQIDTVSGATYTSDAYRQSVQAAIDAR